MPTHNAIIPVPNTQKDFYNWDDRRALKLSEARSGNHDLIFIGDSITHAFELADRGASIWKTHFEKTHPLNLGYGWDCTQNVLWRLQNGEFAGQHPKLVVLNIGTNNLTGNSGGRANTAPEIVEGIQAICQFIHEQSPQTTILVMGIFPRGQASDAIFSQVKEVNALLETALANQPGIRHLDIGDRFLDADGEIPLELMNDRVHPGEKGYTIWAESLEPVVKTYLG